jgi:hypothetical protein
MNHNALTPLCGINKVESGRLAACERSAPADARQGAGRDPAIQRAACPGGHEMLQSEPGRWHASVLIMVLTAAAVVSPRLAVHSAEVERRNHEPEFALWSAASPGRAAVVRRY